MGLDSGDVIFIYDDDIDILSQRSIQNSESVERVILETLVKDYHGRYMQDIRTINEAIIHEKQD